MSPTVSVVVPAYNAQATLNDTLVSILSQTMSDLEVLVVDDGSKDGTWELLQQWQQAEPRRVHAMQHPGGVNRGVAASRNLALDRASGKFIAFVDADDAWLPHKLERQLQAFENLPEHVGVVFSNAWFAQVEPGLPWSAGEQWLPEHAKDIPKLFSGEVGSSLKCLLLEPRNDFRNWVMSPTPLVRASHFRQGLRFIGPPRLSTQFEDYLMWLSLALRCEFVALQEPLAYYRVHQSQFVSRYVRKVRCLEYLRNTREVLQLLLEDGGPLMAHLDLQARIEHKFGEVMVCFARSYRPSQTLTVRSVAMSDVMPLLQMAMEYRVAYSVFAALVARWIDATSHRLLYANRLAGWSRVLLKRARQAL